MGRYVRYRMGDTVDDSKWRAWRMGYRMFWSLSIALSEVHVCLFRETWWLYITNLCVTKNLGTLTVPVISRRDECDLVVLREAGFQRVKCDLTLERHAVGSWED